MNVTNPRFDMLIPTLLSWGLLPWAPVPVHVPDDLSQAAPESTIAWFQTTDHVGLLEAGLEHPLLAKVLSHPLVKGDMERKGQDPAAALAAIEAVLGESPLDLAAALTAEGFGAGMLPPNGRIPRFFFVARGADLDEMEDALDTIIGAATSFGGARELSSSDRAKLGQTVIDAWTIGADGAIAALTSDSLVYLATSLSDLQLITRGAGRALHLLESRRAMGPDSGSFAWLDFAALEERGQLADLRKAAMKPGMHFVLGPVLTYACTARSLGLSLHMEDTGIEVRSRAIGHVTGSGAASFPDASRPHPPLPAPSATEVARAVVHRDVATLLAERTELFPPRTQPAIAEALAKFALLVGGTDAVDELFGSFEPRMLFLAENVPFTQGAVPDVALPAACWVVHLKDPAVNGPRVVGAFQSLIALTNVQRAQNGEPGMVLGLESIEGCTMTLARLAPPAEGDGVDLAYNLAPGCALIGDAVVIGTHHELVKRVAERLARGEFVPDDVHLVDAVTLRAEALAALLHENRDLLVLQAVLNEGKTQERAEMEFDLLEEIVAAIDGVAFTTGGTPSARGVLEASLRITFAQ